MKVTREQAAENRERILDVAGRLFRERGFDGIGVSDLMKAAGLTHGGFYGHFASKEDLIVEVCARALSQGKERWANVAKEAANQPLNVIKGHYLSRQHRDDPGSGCLIAALASDFPRAGPKVRDAVTDGIRGLVDLFSQLLPEGTRAARRRQGINSMAAWIGAVVLARTVNDPKFSNEILDAVASQGKN